MGFNQFLKKLDPTMYGEYIIESYKEDRPFVGPTLEEMDFTPPQQHDSFLLKIATPLDDIESTTNIAVAYVENRKIPQKHWHRLWYLEHTKDIQQLFPRYTKITNNEPRLLIPFESITTGAVIGVALRDLSNVSSLRYINVREDTEEPLIFGWKELDHTQPIYVVEGALDSLFLENAIAVGGTSFGKIESLNLHDPVIIFDNQPRNKEVCKLMEKYIELDYQVCIWPCTIKGKDINEMVLHGVNIQQVIQEHTYTGLIGKIKYNEWRNC